MRPHFLFTVVLLSTFWGGVAFGESRDIPTSIVVLNGEDVQVRWMDGDSFKSAHADNPLKTRIIQFNTLESYGPVHRWGTWTGKELMAVAADATRVAREGQWNCDYVTEGLSRQKDGYGRYLLRCDDLAETLVSKGLAHLLLFKGKRNNELLQVQQEAIRKGVGMWAKGTPSAILTSLHSVEEKRKNPAWLPYNRVGSTRTGQSLTVSHDSRYELCQEVCMRGSCLLYVPFDSRYGENRAPCLKATSTSPETSK